MGICNKQQQQLQIYMQQTTTTVLLHAMIKFTEKKFLFTEYYICRHTTTTTNTCTCNSINYSRTYCSSIFQLLFCIFFSLTATIDETDEAACMFFFLLVTRILLQMLLYVAEIYFLNYVFILQQACCITVVVADKQTQACALEKQLLYLQNKSPKKKNLIHIMF